MLVPIEWLKEFIDFEERPQDIANLFTLSGLEVESIEGDGDKVVFDVNVTPNRADCLSVYGLARELSAITKRNLKNIESDVIDESYDADFDVEIEAKDLCHRYTGRLISGISISESPERIRNRLETSGIRPKNNIVDITNYVLLEYGHPLHAFDFSTLKGNKIKVDRAEYGQRIVTLDGVERKLPEDSLIIWDRERPIAIAGIMGGVETEITESTTDIFLESAYFVPESIRKSSRIMNLKSESSYRFARGTDIMGIEKALNRASFLIREICGGKVSRIIDVYPVRFTPQEIELSLRGVERMLGLDINEEEIKDILDSLGFTVNKVDDSFTVKTPSYRRDIENEADLVEEIARLYGYERIPSKMPKIKVSSKGIDKDAKRILSLKEIMRQSGFIEVINYSFMSYNDFYILEIPESDIRFEAVSLKNPLRENESILRTLIIPSLLENYVHNLSHGIKDINIYELSNVFFRTNKTLPDERLKIAGLYCIDRKSELYKDAVHPFFRIKGIVERLLRELGVKDYYFKTTKEPFLLNAQSADIFLKQVKEDEDGKSDSIGFIGPISPEVVTRLDVKEGKVEIVVFEIYLDVLLALDSGKYSYELVPRYPVIERDMAIIVNDNLPSAEIVDLIRDYPDELIDSVKVFDFYKGKNIDQGKKSLAFRITFKSRERTLTDDEVSSLHNSIVDYVLNKTGGTLR